MRGRESVSFYETKIKEYFDLCDEINISRKSELKTSKNDNKPIKPYTMSGLLCHMQLSYSEFELLREKKTYRRLLNYAKARVESYIEEKALTGELSPSASLASLKCYFGWGEKQDERLLQGIDEGTVMKVILSDETALLAK